MSFGINLSDQQCKNMKIKTVKDLRSFLENYPDNMEVVYYNRFADDWQHLQIHTDELTKLKTSVVKNIVNSERESRGEPKIEKFKSMEVWDLSDLFTEHFELEPEARKDFQFKKVLMISSVPRKKKNFDRIGDIIY